MIYSRSSSGKNLLASTMFLLRKYSVIIEDFSNKQSKPRLRHIPFNVCAARNASSASWIPMPFQVFIAFFRSKFLYKALCYFCHSRQTAQSPDSHWSLWQNKTSQVHSWLCSPFLVCWEIIVRSCSTFNGFDKKPVMPALEQADMSCWNKLAVTAIIGTVFASLRSVREFVAPPQPAPFPALSYLSVWHRLNRLKKEQTG